jgi:hypothetical protein
VRLRGAPVSWSIRWVVGQWCRGRALPIRKKNKPQGSMETSPRAYVRMLRSSRAGVTGALNWRALSFKHAIGQSLKFNRNP